MHQLTIKVPEELLQLAGGSEHAINQLLLESAVMQLLRLRRVSAGQAAELLGVSHRELPALYNAYQVFSS